MRPCFDKLIFLVFVCLFVCFSRVCLFVCFSSNAMPDISFEQFEIDLWKLIDNNHITVMFHISVVFPSFFPFPFVFVLFVCVFCFFVLFCLFVCLFVFSKCSVG